MKIRMKATLSGTRNGQDWPAPGGEIDVPDQEGAELCAAGIAEPIATDPDPVQKRQARRSSKKNEAEPDVNDDA